jgi:copper homeostasis protein CutC
MAGGGVHENNVLDLKALGVDGIHFSGTAFEMDCEGSLFEARLQIPKMDKIKQIISHIRA